MLELCFHHVQVFVSAISSCCDHCWPQKSVSSCLLMSHLISASILGPVFGNQDQYLGLALFLDTFRNDLHGMDVSVYCVPRGDWPACFFAGPVFSNNALFHGLAVFIDTYSNDDATDVSGCSGFTRRHAVSMQICFCFLYFKLACCQNFLSMLTLKTPQNLFCHILTHLLLQQKSKLNHKLLSMMALWQ